jgi:hypothetical protein
VGGASSGGGGSGVHQGPGVTDRTITFGFIYDPGLDEAQRSVGSTGTATGNTRDYAEAVVADVNKRGGIAGRQLKLAFHRMDSNDQATPTDVKWGAACEALTKDTKVLVALPVTNATGRACFAKAAVTTTAATAGSLANKDFADTPSYYDVTALPLESALRNEARALVASGYFSAWNTDTGAPAPTGKSVVGVLVPDLPGWRSAVRSALLPELQKNGISVSSDNIVFWRYPESTQQAGQSVAEIQAAVLKFRSNGVTHFLPGEVNSSSFFGQNAEKQNYRPRYALNSFVGAQLTAGTLLPAEQLRGADGFGRSPVVDQSSKDGISKPEYIGPGQSRCLDVMKRANVTLSGANAQATALTVCDQIYAAVAAVSAVPRGIGINASTVIQGIEGLRGTYASAASPTALFGPDRHYATARAWRMLWDTACSCEKYSGSSYRVD